MDEATDQPRIPGVKYRKVRRHYEETTVIDGVASTRRVPYDAWEPVPPREWDDVILRCITGAAITVTVIAAAGTTASIGGLLGPLVPDFFAYASGAVFTSAWLACLGMEWLHRIDPERAKADRRAGWLMLALGMGAVVVYGHTLDHLEAGIVGAGVDLLSKSLWARLIRYHAVPLAPGVTHWVVEQEQTLAGKALLAGRLSRLNRAAAYREAVGGVEYQAAGAILASARTTITSLPAAAPELTPVQEPAPAPAPAVPPVPPAAPAALVSGQVPETVSAQVGTPPLPPAAPVPPVPGAVQPPADTSAGGTSGQDEQQAPALDVRQISLPSIASVCRTQIGTDPKVTDADLYAAVLAAGHADRPNLADTVRRTAQRVDPTRKAS